MYGVYKSEIPTSAEKTFVYCAANSSTSATVNYGKYGTYGDLTATVMDVTHVALPWVYKTAVLFCKQEETIRTKFYDNTFEMTMPNIVDSHSAKNNRYVGWFGASSMGNAWIDPDSYGGYPWGKNDVQSYENQYNFDETIGTGVFDLTIRFDDEFWNSDGLVIVLTTPRKTVRNVIYKISGDGFTVAHWDAYEGEETTPKIVRNLDYDDGKVKIPFANYWPYRTLKNEKMTLTVENTRISYDKTYTGTITVDIHVRGHASMGLRYRNRCPLVEVDLKMSFDVCSADSTTYDYISIQRPTQYSESFTTSSSIQFAQKLQYAIPVEPLSPVVPVDRSNFVEETKFYDTYTINSYYTPPAGSKYITGLGVVDLADQYGALGRRYNYFWHYSHIPWWFTYWPADMHDPPSTECRHKWLQSNTMPCDDGFVYYKYCHNYVGSSTSLYECVTYYKKIQEQVVGGNWWLKI